MSLDAARPRPTLAPRWHTFALVALIVSVALAGTLIRAASPAAIPAPSTGSVLVVFAQMALVQAALAVYVARVGRQTWRLREIVGATWHDRRRIAVDLAWAAFVVLAIIALETAFKSAVDARPNAATRALLPHTPGETVVWLGVAMVVGVGEELVYRGYLQTHLGALTRSPLAGCVLSASLFGVAHLEQGQAAAARAAVYGLILGLVAWRRGSLIPGVLAHVAVDAAAGLLAH